MRPRDEPEARRLFAALSDYEAAEGYLPGIADPRNRNVLIEQLIESERRQEFVRYLAAAQLTSLRADPTSQLYFDPLRAAALLHQRGANDEAFWMVFLFVLFGRSRSGGWRYARDVYGRLGAGRWNWTSVSSDPVGFGAWMTANVPAIRSGGPGGFGNHRKYESLDSVADSVASYVEWVGPEHSHATRFAAGQLGRDPRAAFGAMYASLDDVRRFGRTARFDYLTTIGRLGLADLQPDRPYLEGATGPLKGARRLFGTQGSPRDMDSALVRLADSLQVSADVIEDGVCNWQKSPGTFTPFRG